MSEYIDNTEKRKETIKSILKQLHDGKSVSEVKAEFAELLEDATPGDISEVEQSLIAEGIPVKEIQNLCDVHVAAFRESLDRQSPDKTPQGHPVTTFELENNIAARILMEFQKTLTELKADPDHPELLAASRQKLAMLRQFDRHYVRKENLLFPNLEKYGFTGPSVVMWGIHNDVRLIWKELASMLEPANYKTTDEHLSQIQAKFSEVNNTMREMFYKESKILFPDSVERLNDADWVSIQSQEEEIGYYFIKPKMDWAPTTSQEPPSQQPLNAVGNNGKNTLISLITGALSGTQLNLMLQNLPIDITFVDENDRVRFFSETKDRVFPRSPAIIGRKVQNCHPPQSLDRVQQIIDDFRSGKSDESEFWIQMQGKFVHIQYFAMRDEDGAYRGTLEVTQDITHIRTLEGEKRL